MAIAEIIGKQFGCWTVKERVDKLRVLCECTCGVQHIHYTSNLRSGKCSKVCRHQGVVHLSKPRKSRAMDWSGMTFANGNLYVIETKAPKSLVRCKFCGQEKWMWTKLLLDGSVRSCGCQHDKNYKDITGQQFGELTAIKFVGNSEWLCKCSCGNTTIVKRYRLEDGVSRSCGCMQAKHMKQTMISRYGDVGAARIGNPRKKWQVEALQDAERLKTGLIRLGNELGYKPTIKELSKMLDCGEATVGERIHRFGLEEYIAFNVNDSYFERCIADYIEKELGLSVERRSKNVLANKRQEVDIYIPDKKIAIECDGDYWHSTVIRDDKMYHYNKSRDCETVGVRLLHIFEHEWTNSENKIKNYLKDVLTTKVRVGARETVVCELHDLAELRSFENEYHLQGYAASKINLGLRDSGGKLVMIMTFGKPRFGGVYEYELIRLCTKSGTTVVGGAEKLWKYFKTQYKPKTVVSYCDMAKFNGGIYKELGFEFKGMTEPGYVWVKGKEVLQRYQTMKGKLLDEGLGEYGDTESDIMEALGYLQIYNCGNKKYLWKQEA